MSEFLQSEQERKKSNQRMENVKFDVEERTIWDVQLFDAGKGHSRRSLLSAFPIAQLNKL